MTQFFQNLLECCDHGLDSETVMIVIFCIYIHLTYVTRAGKRRSGQTFVLEGLVETKTETHNFNLDLFHELL